MGDPFSGWSVDGTPGITLAAVTASAAVLYPLAAMRGRRRDRRGRRWPRGRTACWVAALALLLIDVSSPIGTRADTHLTDHMVEHMVMWLLVAPLLAAAAPMRLALFALSPGGRRRLGRALRSGPGRLLTGPAGSTVLFGAVVVVTALPAVYALTEHDDWVHVTEHALYLTTALLVWAPVLGADPIPHRAGPRGQAVCLVACMVPMALVSGWLLIAAHPVYPGLVPGLGGASAAVTDQRLAALLMLLCGPPAFAVPLALRTVERLLPAPTGPERAPLRGGLAA